MKIVRYADGNMILHYNGYSNMGHTFIIWHSNTTRLDYENKCSISRLEIRLVLLRLGVLTV